MIKLKLLFSILKKLQVISWGIACGISYWLVASLTHFFITEWNFPVNSLLYSAIHEFWSRVIAFVIITVFGIYIKYFVVKMRQMKRQLADYQIMELAFRSNERKYKLLFESSHEGIIFLTLEGRIIDANISASEIYQYSKSDFQQLAIYDLIPDEFPKSFSEEIPEKVITGGIFVETQGKRKNGEIFPVELSTCLLLKKDGDLIILYVRDITKSKEAENAIRESEERYHSIIAAMSEGIIFQTEDGLTHDWNSSAEIILGLTPEQMLSRAPLNPGWEAIHEDGTSFPHNEHPGMVTLKTGKPQANVIMGIQKPKEELTWISITSHPLYKESKPKPYAVVSSYTDITKRKCAELELQRLYENLETQVQQRTTDLLRVNKRLLESERQQKALLDSIPDIAWLKNSDSEIIAVNQAFGQACGLEPTDLIGKTDFDIWPFEQAEKNINVDKMVLEKGESQKVEELLIDHHGQKRWLETIKVPIIDEYGIVCGTAGIGRDITDHKEADIVRRQLHNELEKLVKERTNELERVNRILRAEINERKKTEKALKKSEELYRAIVEDQTELICRFLTDGTLTFVNDTYCRYFNRKRDDLLGKKFMPFIPKEDQLFLEDHFNSLNQDNPVSSVEHRIIKDNGDIRWQQWTNRMIFDDHRELIYIQSVGRDITEHRMAKDQLKASLKEKEVLMREVHHRVKNNLQVIISLLKLQSSYIKDEQYLGMFQDSESRIEAMSLVHEKLYQSNNLANIDFYDYIKDLATELFEFYNMSLDKISLQLNVEHVMLEIDIAVPCGLIISELISNSLKHAFPDSKRGQINVIFRMINESEVELRVSDNGVGFPEYLDYKKSASLGLELISNLTEKQLQGNVVLHKAHGTEFIICFSKSKYKKRI